jgi:nucleoside-diphosphate-sugar epimerase
MNKIAVTGATGFVGNFVSKYLEDRGYNVYRFGRKNIDGVLQWDITLGQYDKKIDIDCIVHCAASVDDWASYEESYFANVVGTGNVLKSFNNVKKIIYISSCSVYDSFCDQVVIKEDECLNGHFLNNYSKTKLLGEMEAKKYNIPHVIILRPHIIYGPGDTTIAPRIRDAIKLGYLFVPGDGSNRISFTHVDNLSQAILSSIKKSEVGISIYNITDDKPFIFSEALMLVRKLNKLNFKIIYIPKNISLFFASIFEFIYKLLKIKKSPILSRYIVDQMSSDHVFDVTKARNELIYNPTKSIENDFYI